MSGRVAKLSIVVALLGLTTVGPATADTTVDQITGNGATDSTLTVQWADGLLNSDNTTTTPRDTGLSFMAPDFQHLAVTVSQTRNLVHQAVNVTWSGFSSNGTNGGFLQMMECYGDASTGPDPEDCEYGSAGLLPGSTPNPGIGTRTGNVCAKGAVAGTTSPPGTLDGESASAGCDTLEPSLASHVAPGEDGTTYSIPFAPVGDPAHPVYGAATNFYNEFSSDEIQDATSNNDGTGQQFFRVLTGTEAPGLGCGEIEESTHQPRDCWLVIVPRGSFKANGFQIGTAQNITGLQTDSPLGRSNWDQRIQIHLGFNPIQSPCPIGAADESETVGTELITHAVDSWQLALNQVANCTIFYGYTPTPEATDTKQLEQTSGAAGLAFTTIPIGSEQARNATASTGTLPPLLYAPVAVSAMTFAFNVSLPGTGGFDTTPIKLTPRLLAKALTQSYRFDLPDYDPDHNQPGPAWVRQNPDNITKDPEFEKLNPNVSESLGTPAAPLVTEDHSEENLQVWQWIDADPAAKAWLSGTPDANGMTADPDYHGANLDVAVPIDSYPRAYSTCGDFGKSTDSPPKEEIKCSLDQLPYVTSLDQGGSAVASSNDPEGATWSPSVIAPDGSNGFWGRGAVETANATFVWSIADSASLANYGLVPADLCDANGNNCVAPSAATVSKALVNATPDSTGLLHVDPAHAGAGAYPLVDVTYAAVRTNQSAAALGNYAKLIQFASGQGQTPGVDPGQLPHGYLPLTDALRAQAGCVVTRLVGGHCGPGVVAPGTPGAHGPVQPGPTILGSGSSGVVSGPQGMTGGATAPSGAKPGPGGQSTTQLPPALAARATPNQLPGAVRWVLLAVVITGAVGAVGGGLLRADDTVLTKMLSRLRW